VIDEPIEHIRTKAKAEAAKRDYENPAWPISRVLRWVAWRDPLKINKEWKHLVFYPAVDSQNDDPPPTLLRALQEGALRAIDSGQELQPESWFRTALNALPDVDFRREDVLKLWPPLPRSLDQAPLQLGQQTNQPSRGSAATTPPPSRLKPFWLDADAVIKERLEDEGCPTPGDGNQAKLEKFTEEWLVQRGYEASESAVRATQGSMDHWGPPMTLQ
jgi:hypothetical protein